MDTKTTQPKESFTSTSPACSEKPLQFFAPLAPLRGEGLGVRGRIASNISLPLSLPLSLLLSLLPSPLFAQFDLNPLRQAFVIEAPKAPEQLFRLTEESASEIIRGLIQNELAVVKQLCTPDDPESAAFLQKVEAEWKQFAKPMGALLVGTSLSMGTQDRAIERQVQKWVEATLPPEKSRHYEEELNDRDATRKEALLTEILRIFQAKLQLSESQIAKARTTLETNWKTHWFRSIEGAYDGEGGLAPVERSWIDWDLTKSQRNALIARRTIHRRWADVSTYPYLQVKHFFTFDGAPKGVSVGSTRVQVLNIANQPGRVIRMDPVRGLRIAVDPAQVVVPRGIIPDIEEMGVQARGVGVHGRLSRNDMEENLYGTLGGSKQAFRNQRRDTVQRHIDRIGLVCDLTPKQKEKLEQSIDIDIERTETKISSLLSEIDETTTPERKQAIYQSAFLTVQLIKTEQDKDENSIWKKVLHATLTEEQAKRLEEEDQLVADRNSRSDQFRLLLLAQRRLGLIKPQREKLSSFIALPNNANLESVQALRKALLTLSPEEREAILPPDTFRHWSE